MAGLWCVNVGYGRPEMAEAIARQIERLSYYHGFSSMATEAPALLAERVLASTPGPHVEGVLRVERLGRERHAGEARLVLQQRPRPAREEEARLAGTAATTA